MKTCQCGKEFEPDKNKKSFGHYRCPDCVREYKREWEKNYRKKDTGITAEEARTCKDCGIAFTAWVGLKKNDIRYYCCEECSKARRKKSSDAFQARQRQAREEKVHVIGTDPEAPMHQRNDIRLCFWDSIFTRLEFEKSTQEGCMDGALVQMPGGRYYVRHGALVEAGA